MEEVYASLGSGKVFSGAGIDPLGPVACNNFDLLAPVDLFQLLTEELKDAFSTAEMNPAHLIPVEVVDNGDVLVTAMVGSLVNADPVQVLETNFDVGFQAVMSCFDAVAHCVPVDVHEFTDNRLGACESHECYLIVEVRRKP